MKSKLARIFIERNIIQKGSIFEAYYNTKGISGQLNSTVRGSFKLIGAQAVGEWVFFNTVGPDNAEHRIRCDQIISLDGMPIARIAESHQLNLEGENAPSNRRTRRIVEDDDEDFD